MSAKRKGSVSTASKQTLSKRKTKIDKESATIVCDEESPYRCDETGRECESNDFNPKALRFIDLFCGIGGFRIAFEGIGGDCVFSSDYDKFSQQSYEANFGERPHGDINTIAVKDIPKHDILCGGFPCQPFSIAGVSKKISLGRSHGFDDVKQGNLFFAIADILEYHRPAAFVLENVKNLRSHDKGRTFRIIYDTLTQKLGYTVYTKIIDARSVVPQHRERIFLIGFREKRHFEFPEFPRGGPKLGSILEPMPDPKYTLTDHLWRYLQNYAAKHKASGNGFGYGLVTENDTTRTLSARYHKDGSEILLEQKGKNPRRLTPRECARLMGYPDSFKIQVSDTQAYRQFGNSVVVGVVERLAQAIMETLKSPPMKNSEFRLSFSEMPRKEQEHSQIIVKPVTYRNLKRGSKIKRP